MNKKYFARASQLSTDDFSLDQRIADGIKNFSKKVSFVFALPEVLPFRVRRSASQLADVLESTGVVDGGEGMKAVESMGNFYEVITISAKSLIIDRPEVSKSESYRIRYGRYDQVC